MLALFSSRDLFFIKQLSLRSKVCIINVPVLCVKFKVYQVGLVVFPSASQTILTQSVKNFRIVTE